MSEKKISLLFLGLFLMVSLSSFALLAEENTTEKNNSWKYGVTYGQDLSEASKVLLFNQFPLAEGISSADLKITKINNEEEWQILRNIVNESEIGNQALSAVYVRTLDAESGLQVKKHYSSGASERMYANAFFTAGLKDLEIFLTGAIEQDGLASLVTAFKAAETIGQAVPIVNRRLAAEELVLISKLGERIGQAKAADYLESLKGIDFSGNDQTFEQAIKKTAQNENISLNETEEKEWQGFLQSIQALKIDKAKMTNQLQAFHDRESELPEDTAEDNWLGKVITFFQTLVDRLFSFVNGGLNV